ncbi:MAG: CDP-glycerol glycerophosphotransferase family protein [Bacillota bacterium]|nr:CDP-glycerol glycerophosphotransferase family protein [Bacillota bacterium]
MDWCKKYTFKIIKLEWERIFLHFEIESDYEGTPEFVLARFGRNIVNKRAVEKKNAKPVYKLEIEETVKVVPEYYQEGVYHFTLNIAAVNGRSFLENGQWRIAAIVPEGFCVSSVCNEIGYKLDEMSRIFRYGRGKYAYNMSFSLNCFDGKNLELFFNSYFMIMNKSWGKRRYIQEAFHLPGKINRTYMYAVIRLIRLFYKVIAAVTPKDGTRILFMSETKDYLWGNLKYIHDRILERGLDKQFDITVSCRRAVGSHKSIASWVKTVINIAKHDFIFIDDYAPIFGFFKLSPKTKLIQVWHAGEGFKSVGYSRFGKNGSPFPSESCHKAYDYALTGSQKLVKVYEEVFGIEQEAFLPVGMPRLDDFLNEDKIMAFKEDFYKKYPEIKNKKVILFAPTFRGTGQREAYYDYDKLDLKQLYEFCNDEYVILIKMHPFVQEKIKIDNRYSDRIFDFDGYPDINELYYITDLLITDYSSNYYEYALMNKPVLFYTYDREMYELTRGVHRSVKDSAPGKVCDTFEEMMTALKNEDFEKEKIYKFVEENFSEYDGHACDRVIDSVLLKKEN